MKCGIVGSENETQCLWKPSKLRLLNFPENINILFEESFRKTFIEEAIKKVGSFRALAKYLKNPKTKKSIFHSTVCRWYSAKGSGKRNCDNYMSLWAVKKIYNITVHNLN